MEPIAKLSFMNKEHVRIKRRERAAEHCTDFAPEQDVQW
jgi:hypothetical protein